MCVCPQYMYLRIGSSMHYCRIHIQHLPVIAACHPRRMGRWICATHGILQIQKPKKLPWRAREALEGRNGKQQLSPQELGRCSALSTAIHQEKANISQLFCGVRSLMTRLQQFSDWWFQDVSSNHVFVAVIIPGWESIMHREHQW